MLWKVSSITRNQLPFYFYFTVSGWGGGNYALEGPKYNTETTPFLFLLHRVSREQEIMLQKVSQLPQNNSLFISMCILRDLPQQKKNPRALLWEGSSLNFMCSPVPMEIFLFLPNEKIEARKQKESCLHKGKFQYPCILLRFQDNNTLGLSHPPVPSSLRRTHSYGNLPLQENDCFAEVGLSVYYICMYHCVYHPCSLK